MVNLAKSEAGSYWRPTPSYPTWSGLVRLVKTKFLFLTLEKLAVFVHASVYRLAPGIVIALSLVFVYGVGCHGLHPRVLVLISPGSQGLNCGCQDWEDGTTCFSTLLVLNLQSSTCLCLSAFYLFILGDRVSHKTWSLFLLCVSGVSSDVQWLLAFPWMLGTWTRAPQHTHRQAAIGFMRCLNTFCKAGPSLTGNSRL